MSEWIKLLGKVLYNNTLMYTQGIDRIWSEHAPSYRNSKHMTETERRHRQNPHLQLGTSLSHSEEQRELPGRKSVRI